MITVALVVIVLIVVAASIVWRLGQKRRGNPFDGFTQALKEAADEGERAYRNQVVAISRGSDSSTVKGVALARFLSALFPACAYFALDEMGAINPSFKKAATLDGAGSLNLASGVALQSLDVTSAHPEFADVKADVDVALRAVVGYFQTDFGSSPKENLGRAYAKLGPLWNKALEYSVGKADKREYARQYCTSGLHLFTMWLQALRG